MKRTTALVLAAVVLLGGAAFFLRSGSVPEGPEHGTPVGGGAVPSGAATPPPPAAPRAAVPVPASVASAASPEGSPPQILGGAPKPRIVRGSVRLAAPPPKRKNLNLGADPRCAALNPAPLPDDKIVADAGLGVRWAFVYVKKGAPTLAAPPAPVLLTQAGCRYEPHVLGIQVGQALRIVNADPFLHNIHALPFANKEFNFGQPTAGLRDDRRFAVPEVMVMLKCDIHPWMSAWVGVLDHPFFAVTDAAGAYQLPELPAGHYELEVWHEAYQSVSQALDLPADDGAVVNFQLAIRK